MPRGELRVGIARGDTARGDPRIGTGRGDAARGELRVGIARGDTARTGATAGISFGDTWRGECLVDDDPRGEAARGDGVRTNTRGASRTGARAAAMATRVGDSGLSTLAFQGWRCTLRGDTERLELRMSDTGLRRQSDVLVSRTRASRRN